jgi:hypothetical protein
MDYHLLIPLIPFLIGIIFKSLLDLNLATFIVKYLHWLPVRAIFRKKHSDISGIWIQTWHNNSSPSYADESSRTSRVRIYQLGSYCYGEFRTKNDEEYYLLGEIIGKHVVGKWSDRIDELGYSGAFELRIVDKHNLVGFWMGHSNRNPDVIKTNQWEFKRK